ncbi:3438_t:CDS:1 [Dentiscutata erythropus]|uniref:3438_t:CDS:1 n=1 Tax=Dentiscutata erythropus TaxID=1348616 RepID=A0A9N9I942_9GLOM|nr:3438_t:CDS:1 [Dentiscutata erythropus]
MTSVIASRLPPEILQDIFKYNVEIKNHHARYKSLFETCLLVNRYWSMNAISIIWEDPLNTCVGKEKSLEKILKVYISNLPKISKSLLKNSENQFEISLKQPTFNYASFLQKLELQGLYEAINRLILHKACYSKSSNKKTTKQRIGLLQELVKLFVSESPKLTYQINMNSIKWDESIQFESLLGIIPYNSTLDRLSCFTSHAPEVYLKISKIFSEINDLQISCVWNDSFNWNDNTALVSLINTLSTSPLKLTLNRCSEPIPQITNSLRYKLNNITSLIIYERGSIPLETFQECTRLKLFRLKLDNFEHYYDDDAKKDADELKDIIKYKSLNNLDEFDLCQLAVNNQHISSVLQNTNNNLKVLKMKWIKSIDPENEELPFKSITENCTMLKELVISLTASTVKYFPTCIRTLTRLQNLTVERYEDDQLLEEDMCIWAEAFGKNIPLSIKVLSLDKNLNLNNEAFDKFLCRCYSRGINNLHLIINRLRIIHLDEKIKETLQNYVQSGTLSSEINS